MKSFLLYNILWIVWSLVILMLCLMPGRDLPSVTIWEFDKIVHFFVYVVLSLLMYYGWLKQNTFPSLRTRTIMKILVITFAYGFAVEVIQELFTADRHFDILDALANATGAVAGSLISKKIIRPE